MARSTHLLIIAPMAIAALVMVPIAGVLWSLTEIDRGTVAAAISSTWAGYGLNTVLLMASVALLSGVIGVSTAWVVSTMTFPGRRALSSLLVLPLAAPAYIVAYLYTDLLDYTGPVQGWLRASFDLPPHYWFPEIRSLPGAALMLSLVLYPYVYLLARASFLRQGAAPWLAARCLGDSPWRAFTRVALPMARPAIAGGLALVMMETLADFGVAQYFAVPTFSVGLFRTWLAMGDKVLALQMAAMMLCLVALLVLLEVLSRRGRIATEGAARHHLAPMVLSPKATIGAWILCGFPILFGFLIPMARLVSLTLAAGDPQMPSALMEYTLNTAKVGVAAAIAALLLAIVMAAAARQAPNPAMRSGIRLATLGYALPGTLLAIGLLSPIGALDQSLTRLIRNQFGWEAGLLLTGTIALLVYALVIRFLTVAYNSVASGLAQISPSTEAAARSLGAPPLRVIRTIHLPMSAPSVLAGGMLVLIDVFRELPATLILRPFNFETLATRVYRLASDERLAEASTAALIIVLLGLVPVWFLNRASETRTAP
ncbi:iron(III) ABC transporter permease protein [Parvularcula bermudensis HTCC2503]|uniref:Iron(III) ABC transporter permease protein n=1 Tax=Parvularcula bermudensis (strain ATCC BAA-594 / HTCC2503 / KCTC 12087) TaxID=314260 RepID=E0THF4_PARBH|nr:iron ABC transporter permease [Parvularcula bermudensis]ADM10746.1 iron(III) ABC transporter permease protein [Parvularcula bermudensis HTCC2503]